MAGVDRCNSPKSLVSGSNESTGPFNFILQQRIDEPAIGKAINLYWVPNTPNFVYIDAAWIVWIMQKQCLHCTQHTLDNTHGLISRPSRTTFSLSAQAVSKHHRSANLLRCQAGSHFPTIIMHLLRNLYVRFSHRNKPTVTRAFWIVYSWADCDIIFLSMTLRRHWTVVHSSLSFSYYY